MEYTPVQQVIDSVIQGKYSECATLLAGRRFDKFDVDEWIQLNNTLACEFKLSPVNALAGIKKQYDDLLQQIKGVFLTDELLSLLAVATHNLFFILLMSEFTHTDVIRLYDGCGKGYSYLQETLKCVCDHYGISVADNEVVSLTNALVEFTNKRSHTEHTGVYLLLYSCAVGYVLSANFKEAQILINYLREKLHGINASNMPQAKSTYLLCHSHTAKCITTVLCNLSSELLIMTQFLLQEWESFLQSIRNCEENQQYMHSELQYLKCWLYFKKDNFEECLTYAEVEAGKCILDNSKVAARFFNMVGCCLSCQGKHHSAIQKFQKALSTDFKCLLPLYNISLQYRNLILYSAELECLNLLLSGLHNNSSSGCDELSHHNVTVPCSLIKGCGFLSGEISEVQVLYLLAKRCYQLHRYDKASEKYRELIKLLTSEQTKHQHEQPVTNHLGKINLHQVHKEAAYCLLSAGYYDECIRICDKFLEVMGMDSSCGNNTLSSVHTGRLGLPGNSEDEAEDDFFGLLTDEKVVSELKQMRRQSQAAGGKAYNSATTTDIACHDSMLAVLYYKADALAHTGCICDALECLNRLTDMIENHQQERSAKCSKTKKQKLEDEMDTDDGKIFGSTEETMQLLQCAYLNKSMLLIAENRYTQALQVSRLAIQLNPGCVTSLYTHSLALVKLGRQREACSTWLSHRKLDVRGDSLHVQRLLQKRKDLLRSSEKEDMETLASSSVTSEDWLKLDIYCITYIRDKRWPVMS